RLPLRTQVFGSRPRGAGEALSRYWAIGFVQADQPHASGAMTIRSAMRNPSSVTAKTSLLASRATTSPLSSSCLRAPSHSASERALPTSTKLLPLVVLTDVPALWVLVRLMVDFGSAAAALSN